MRIVGPALVLAMLASIMGGCASRDVAVVADHEEKVPLAWDASDQVPPGWIKESDRLVVFRVSNKNPLKFRNELMFRQYPKAAEGRSFLTIYPQAPMEDTLVLVKFTEDGGDTVFAQPMPCLSRAWCAYSTTSGEKYFEFELPPAGQIIYAGHLHYEIEDEFPERGTQNFPSLKNVIVTSEPARDLAEAQVKWPLLKDRDIATKPAVVKEGRAAVFRGGSKESRE